MSRGKKASDTELASPKLLPIVEATTTPRRKSAFDGDGFQTVVDSLCAEIRELYIADDVPWVIGYSGGKDSTATLQLVWQAVAGLPESQRQKAVHVISTDTLVENPIVAAWVEKSHARMTQVATESQMPFVPRMLRPNVDESFWVNLIGRGYPAPRHKFRWCTERLKIRPSNRFISQVVTDNGEAILCLGARSAESTARARVLNENRKYRVRDRLSPSATLAGCMIYTPIESWTNDDVWIFLNRMKNPWGLSNKELMGMYAGASPDGECPLVVDDSTPSCGDSRFGCWVCTLVEQDKSMTAMIQNDVDKEWMQPLLDLRNALDFRSTATGEPEEGGDRHLRDFRRMTGAVQVMASGAAVPGPYTQATREKWLRMLLQAQTYIRQHGPREVASLELISLDELAEIRRMWVVDKHELEDSLPRIYEETTGVSFPGESMDEDVVLGPAEMNHLRELCGDDRLHYELTRELLSLTRQQRNTARRAGLFEQLEKSFGKHYFDSVEDAVSRANAVAEAKKQLAEKKCRGPSSTLFDDNEVRG